MKKILLVIALIVTIQNAYSEVNKEITNKLEKLIQDQKYETAFKTLVDNKDEYDFSYYSIKKAEIALNYFVLSTMHQMFAFKDIPEGESVYDYRGNEGRYNYYMYKPDEELVQAIKLNEDNGELYFWLGQYYYEVLQKYSGNWIKPDEELKKLVIENYELAKARKFENKELLSNLGQMYLRDGEYKKSEENLSKAIDIDDSFAGYHHNLAIALLNQKKNEEALNEAEKSIDLYEDAYYRADSYYLAAMITIEMNAYNDSIKYLELGKKLQPNDYRFYDQLITLYLYQKQSKEADANSVLFFNLYPKNPSVIQSIMEKYHTYNQMENLENLYSQLIKKNSDNEILGNLFFHKAICSDALDKSEVAIEELEKSRAYFMKVFGEDNEVFKTIDGFIKQISG